MSVYDDLEKAERHNRALKDVVEMLSKQKDDAYAERTKLLAGFVELSFMTGYDAFVMPHRDGAGS